MTKSIMVVDDDDTTRFMMSEFLESLGYACHAVSSGTQCVAELEDSPDAFSMVLMDIHMPGVTGLQTSRMIRKCRDDPPRSIPIVAMTADSAYHTADSVRPYGIDDVLPKPVHLHDLGAKLTQRQVPVCPG